MNFEKSTFIAVCYLLFTFGYIISGGFYHIGELIILLVVFVTVLIFYLKPAILTQISIPKSKEVLIFVLSIIATTSVALVGAKLGDSAQTNWMIFSALNRILAGLALFLALSFFLKNPPNILKNYRFPTLLSIAMLIRLFSIFSAPNPPTDVFYIIRDGTKLILEGKNPYELSYPAPYGVFIPTIIFHYGPLTPLLFLPSVALFNDPRFTLIFVEFLSAFIIYKLARQLKLDELVSKIIITIFLFHPFFAFMTEHSWPEPIVTLFILTAIYYMAKNKNSLVGGIALGLVLAIKSVYLAPLFVMLIKMQAKFRNLLILVILPLVLSLPFLILDYKLFLERTQIYVTDPGKIANVLAPTNISLSISAVILKYTNIVLPSYIAAVPGVLMTLVAITIGRKKFSFAPIAAFLVFMAFFMFGPFAFLYNFAMMGNLLLISILFFAAGEDKS